MRIIKQISSNIILNGKNYPVVIQYKARKKSNTFRYRDGTFLITCPGNQRKTYLLNQLTKVAPKLIAWDAKPILECEDFIYLFGEKYDLTSKHICFLNNDLYFNDLKDLKSQLFDIFGREVVKQVIYYQKLMGIINPYKIQIKELKSKYGSNSRATHTLVFNFFLIHFDIEMLKSVVVHELAHCFEFNHGPNFWKIVYKYYPNYNIIDKKLKKGIVK